MRKPHLVILLLFILATCVVVLISRKNNPEGEERLSDRAFDKEATVAKATGHPNGSLPSMENSPSDSNRKRFDKSKYTNYAQQLKAEGNSEYARFRQLLEEAFRNGDPKVIAERATQFWATEFAKIPSLIEMKSDFDGVAELDEFYQAYRRQYEEIRPPEPPVSHKLSSELESGNGLSNVGALDVEGEHLMVALVPAFSAALEASNGRNLTRLLAALSENAEPTQSDLLVYRVFKENHIIGGDFPLKLNAEDKAFNDQDLSAFEQLASHPNPVARLAALESIQWIRSPEKDQLLHERFSKLVGSTFLGEKNKTVQRELVDYAFHNRDANSLRVLESLREQVAGAEQELKVDLEQTIMIVRSQREEDR